METIVKPNQVLAHKNIGDFGSWLEFPLVNGDTCIERQGNILGFIFKAEGLCGVKLPGGRGDVLIANVTKEVASKIMQLLFVDETAEKPVVLH